jgi:hypothetical protein
MSIVKTELQPHKFSIINTFFLEDTDLSWKVKGILSYLLTKPNNWIVRITDLCNKSPNGKTEIRSAMKDLIKYGYAKVIYERDENSGRLKGKTYVISDLPIYLKDKTTETQNHRSKQNPSFGKPEFQQTNTISNTDLDSNIELNSNTKKSKLVSKSQDKKNENTTDIPTHQETFGLYEEKNNVAESLQQTDIPKSKSPYKAKEDCESTDSDAEKVLFKYSMYADKNKLRQALDASLYEVCKLADAEWYAYRAMSWSDSKKVMLSNELWLNTIIKFISEDKSKGELRKKDTTANQDKPSRKKEIVW